MLEGERMREDSDAELLTRWRGGDRGASQILAQRHYPSVLRYFELNASWAAEDLAQKTFMAAVERTDHVRDGSAFRAYLMGIARRQLAMYQRELSRQSPQDAYAASDAQVQRIQGTKLSTIVARGREQLLVLRALSSLPRRPQLLLILFYWEGMNTLELATHFDVPASTVRSRLARARDQLRVRMSKMAGRAPQAAIDDDALARLFATLTRASPGAPP